MIFTAGGSQGPSAEALPKLESGLRALYRNFEYDSALTRLPQPEPVHARDDWKPHPGIPFPEASRGGDDGHSARGGDGLWCREEMSGSR
jgi:hypothetical protein